MSLRKLVALLGLLDVSGQAICNQLNPVTFPCELLGQGQGTFTGRDLYFDVAKPQIALGLSPAIVLGACRPRPPPTSSLTACTTPAAYLCPVAIKQLRNVTETFPGNMVIGQWHTTVNVTVGPLGNSLQLPPAMCGLVTALRSTGVSGRMTFMLTGHLINDVSKAMDCPLDSTDGDMVKTSDFTPTATCTASTAVRLGAALPSLGAAVALAAAALFA